MDPDQLALVPDDELFEEIGRRFDHVAILVDGPLGKPAHCRRWAKDGDTLAAIGLCHWAADDFSQGWTTVPTEADEEEDE